MINGTVLNEKFGGCFFGADLKDHFLASLIKGPEVMRIPLSFFPSNTIQKYNRLRLATNGYVYIKIKKERMD